jgi:ribulose-5-phosphate 4-epimerase/fuculose-1-phosphate aldolase
MARRGIPLYPSSLTIQSDEQGEEFAKVMGDSDVALMRGHGIAAAGNSIEQSTLNALNLEYLCRIFYKCYAIGTPMPLPESDLLRPARQVSDGPRTRGSAGGVEGMMASWRYYVSLTEEKLAAVKKRDEA